MKRFCSHCGKEMYSCTYNGHLHCLGCNNIDFSTIINSPGIKKEPCYRHRPSSSEEEK